jgi:hypothetical protein
MILNYKNYLNEKLENKFSDIQISEKITNFFGYHKNYSMMMFWEAILAVETDISYIDLGSRNDMISYLSYDKFLLTQKQLTENPRYKGYIVTEEFYESNQRQEMKIGKFINKIFKDTEKEISPTQVEEIINLYKHYIDSLTGKYNKMKVVTGEDIRHWYNEKYYKPGDGSLNNSCMKDKDEGHRLDIFVDNPKQVSLLILTDKNNELIGRALIWKLINGGIYMDRIYTVTQHDIEVFNKYAFDNNFETTKYIEDRLPDKQKHTLKVKLPNLKHNKPSEYPFMDTFQHCNLNSNILSNHSTENRQYEIILTWW